MQKIDLNKLMSLIQKGLYQNGFIFILTDEVVVSYLLKDFVPINTKKKIKIFEGLKSLEECFSYCATPSLFEPWSHILFCLEDTLSDKTWKQIKTHLSRLQLENGQNFFLLAKTSCRNLINTEETLKNSSFFLSYSPSDSDILKTTKTFFEFFETTTKSVDDLALELMDYYGNNYLSSYLHLKRMSEGQLEFEQAFLLGNDANVFHVINSLLQKNSVLIDLRIRQCLQNNEEPSSILYAVVHFLKQVTQLRSCLSKDNDFKKAFILAKIPFPAQDRLRKALTVFSQEKIVAFFLSFSDLELELRNHKNYTHSLLVKELIGLII